MTFKLIHGFIDTAEYHSWSSMKGRCLNKNNAAYDRYGGRGVKVCDRWLFDFLNFLADMGPRPSVSHSLDRINNNGNYEPSNCRWATKLEQSSNRRNIIFVNELPLKQYCAKVGISYRMVHNRMHRFGWPIEKALDPIKRKGGFKNLPYTWSRRKKVDGDPRTQFRVVTR